jgi:hypothetical protein
VAARVVKLSTHVAGKEKRLEGRPAACDVDPCSRMKAWRIKTLESQIRVSRFRRLFFFETNYDSGEE